jgi:hypothetical protein
MLDRRHGRCDLAEPRWREALKLLPLGNGDGAGVEWSARAWLGLALCSLGRGQAVQANDLVTRAFVNGNRDEVGLIMGLCHDATGDSDAAFALVLTASRAATPEVRRAALGYLIATRNYRP